MTCALEKRAEVVIVGGGLCGLALAERLQRAGADYVLLEARDRLGGRILSQAVGPGRFDFGPAWFWRDQPRMAALAGRLKLEVFEQYADGDMVFEGHDGRVIHAANSGGMAGSLRIDGGMGRLTDGLAGDLPANRIRLGAAVRALTDTGTGLRIDCAGGGEAIEASQVVFALPPRLLAGSIAFTPALSPAVRQGLEAVPTWMAGQAKIVAVYDEPFWRAAGLSGDAVSRKGPLGEIHDASSLHGPPALFGFVGVAPEVRRAHRDRVLELARLQLGSLFGDPALHPRAMLFKDWAHDSLTAMPEDLASAALAYPMGQPAAWSGLWDGRVWVSGTETARASGGYLEGALDAAEAVADALLAKA